MSENIPTPQLPPVKIAFVIDNKVVDILHTDERLGAIFLSDPLIIDISDKVDNNGNITVKVNYNYDPQTKTFSSLG